MFLSPLRGCECFIGCTLFHLILRNVAKRSVSKDGNAKNGAAAIMRCIGTVPVATLRDTPLRSVPQGEVGVQRSAERFTSSHGEVRVQHRSGAFRARVSDYPTT